MRAAFRVKRKSSKGQKPGKTPGKTPRLGRALAYLLMICASSGLVACEKYRVIVPKSMPADDASAQPKVIQKPVPRIYPGDYADLTAHLGRGLEARDLIKNIAENYRMQARAGQDLSRSINELKMESYINLFMSYRQRGGPGETNVSGMTIEDGPVARYVFALQLFPWLAPVKGAPTYEQWKALPIEKRRASSHWFKFYEQAYQEQFEKIVENPSDEFLFIQALKMVESGALPKSREKPDMLDQLAIKMGPAKAAKMLRALIDPDRGDAPIEVDRQGRRVHVEASNQRPSFTQGNRQSRFVHTPQGRRYLESGEGTYPACDLWDGLSMRLDWVKFVRLGLNDMSGCEMAQAVFNIMREELDKIRRPQDFRGKDDLTEWMVLWYGWETEKVLNRAGVEEVKRDRNGRPIIVRQANGEPVVTGSGIRDVLRHAFDEAFDREFVKGFLGELSGQIAGLPKLITKKFVSGYVQQWDPIAGGKVSEAMVENTFQSLIARKSGLIEKLWRQVPLFENHVADEASPNRATMKDFLAGLRADLAMAELLVYASESAGMPEASAVAAPIFYAAVSRMLVMVGGTGIDFDWQRERLLVDHPRLGRVDLYERLHLEEQTRNKSSGELLETSEQPGIMDAFFNPREEPLPLALEPFGGFRAAFSSKRSTPVFGSWDPNLTPIYVGIDVEKPEHLWLFPSEFNLQGDATIASQAHPKRPVFETLDDLTELVGALNDFLLATRKNGAFGEYFFPADGDLEDFLEMLSNPVSPIILPDEAKQIPYLLLAGALKNLNAGAYGHLETLASSELGSSLAPWLLQFKEVITHQGAMKGGATVQGVSKFLLEAAKLFETFTLLGNEVRSEIREALKQGVFRDLLMFGALSLGAQGQDLRDGGFFREMNPADPNAEKVFLDTVLGLSAMTEAYKFLGIEMLRNYLMVGWKYLGANWDTRLITPIEDSSAHANASAALIARPSELIMLVNLWERTRPIWPKIQELGGLAGLQEQFDAALWEDRFAKVQRKIDRLIAERAQP